MKAGNACIYVRVSTGIEKQSTTRQINELKAYALQHGYKIEEDDVYSENISGFTKSSLRPIFSKMIDQITNGEKKYTKIFISEVSRISRNPIEGRRIVDNLSEMGIAIHVQNNNLCSLDSEGKPDFMFSLVYNVLLEFARSEAEYTKMRSISGTRDKVRRGHAGAGVYKAFGYRRDENKMLVIDDDEAEVVKDIFNYVLEGYGTKQIAHILNDRGIRTKGQKVVKKGYINLPGSKLTKETKNMVWVDGVVYSILKNPIYKGERKYAVDKIEENGKKKKIYETVPAPVIIASDIWNKVQSVMSERATEGSRTTRYLYLLKGLLKCSICGRNYVAKYRPGGKDAFFECSSRRTKCCGNRASGIQVTESVVWDVVRESHQLSEYLKSTGVELQRANQEIKQLKLQLKMHEHELLELEGQKERLIEMRLKNMISVSRMDEEFQKAEKSQEGYEKVIIKLKKQIEALSKLRIRLSNIDNYIELIKNMENDRFQIAQVLNNILDRVWIRGIEREGNQYKYVLSIKMMNLEKPITVLMITNQGNTKLGQFILPRIYNLVGHNKVKYINGGMVDISYSDNILITPVEKVIEMLTDTQEQTIYTSKIRRQQSNYQGNLCEVNEKFELLDYCDEIVETIPFLLPMDGNNALEQVTELKGKMKSEKQAI